MLLSIFRQPEDKYKSIFYEEIVMAEKYRSKKNIPAQADTIFMKILAKKFKGTVRLGLTLFWKTAQI